MKLNTFISFIVIGFVLNANQLLQASDKGPSLWQLNESIEKIRKQPNDPRYDDLKKLREHSDAISTVISKVNSAKPATYEQQNLIITSLINSYIGVKKQTGCTSFADNRIEERYRIARYGMNSRNLLDNINSKIHQSTIAAINIGLLASHDIEHLHKESGIDCYDYNYLKSLFYTPKDWMTIIKTNASKLIKYLAYDKTNEEWILNNILNSTLDSYERIFGDNFMRIYLNLLDSRNGYRNIVAKDEAYNLQLVVMYSQFINNFKTSKYIYESDEISEPHIIMWNNSTYVIYKNHTSIQHVPGKLLLEINPNQDSSYSFVKLKRVKTEDNKLSKALSGQSSATSTNYSRGDNPKETERIFKFLKFDIKVNLPETIKNESFQHILEIIWNSIENCNQEMIGLDQIQYMTPGQERDKAKRKYAQQVLTLVEDLKLEPKDKLIRVFNALLNVDKSSENVHKDFSVRKNENKEKQKISSATSTNYSSGNELKETKRTFKFNEVFISINLNENITTEDFTVLLNNVLNIVNNDVEFVNSMNNVQVDSYDYKRTVITMYQSKLTDLFNKYKFTSEDKLTTVLMALFKKKIDDYESDSSSNNTTDNNLSTEQLKIKSIVREIRESVDKEIEPLSILTQKLIDKYSSKQVEKYLRAVNDRLSKCIDISEDIKTNIYNSFQNAFKKFLNSAINLQLAKTTRSNVPEKKFSDEDVRKKFFSAQDHVAYELFNVCGKTYTNFVDGLGISYNIKSLEKDLDILQTLGGKIYLSPGTGDCGLFPLGMSREWVLANVDSIKKALENLELNEEVAELISIKTNKDPFKSLSINLISILGHITNKNVFIWNFDSDNNFTLTNSELYLNGNFYQDKCKNVHIAMRPGHYDFLIPYDSSYDTQETIASEIDSIARNKQQTLSNAMGQNDKTGYYAIVDEILKNFGDNGYVSYTKSGNTLLMSNNAIIEEKKSKTETSTIIELIFTLLNENKTEDEIKSHLLKMGFSDEIINQYINLYVN